MSSAVHYELRSGVAHVTLSAPKSGNALNTPLIRGICDSVRRGIEESSCRVIVIRAAGHDFCRGMDFGSVHGAGSELREMGKAFGECLTVINGSPKPVIGCAEGHATGGGVGLLAACDVVLATENVTFTLPEVIIGMIPALVTPFLLRRMPARRVRYMAISSRSIGAVEAWTYGLVDEIVNGEMQVALNKQLQRLFCSSPAALAEVKRYFERLESDELQREIQAAFDQLEQWLGHENAIEGVRTFAEGFAPSWFEKYKERRHADQDSRPSD